MFSRTIKKMDRETLKSILSKLNPSLNKQLPHGCIKQLSEEFDIHITNIAKILRGEMGTEENVKGILLRALTLIEEDARKSEKKADKIRSFILKKSKAS